MSLFISKRIGGDTSTGWKPNKEWVKVPSFEPNEEVFYGIHAVYNTTVNPITLMCTGNYTVDWGDGSTPQNFASNAIAEKNINWSNVAGKPTSDGYKTVLVKVTPQAGATITLLDLYKTSTLLGTHDYMHAWLAIYNNFGSAYFRHWGARSQVLECIYQKIEKSGDTNININFKGIPRLQKIEVSTWQQLSIDGAFRDCPMLDEIGIDLSVVTSAQYAFAYSGNAMPLNANFPALINAFAYALNNTGTKLPTISNTVTNLQYAFKGFCFDTIPAVNCANVTSFANWLPDARQIRRSLAYGGKASVSYANQLMSDAAINEAGDNAGTANAGATVDFRGNPGYSTATASKWTSKGYTWL